MKAIIFALFLMPSIGLAKDYQVKMSICDTQSNCKKCHESVELTYGVDAKKKTVTAIGKDTTGNNINEVLDKCSVQDSSNWSCDSASGKIGVTNGQVSFLNRKDSSLGNSGKKICLVK